MGFFNHSPKPNIQDCCRGIYDNVFNAAVGGQDFNKLYWKSVFDHVTEADPSFAAVDFDAFCNEIVAIRVELICLAWMHRFGKNELTFPQIIFTRSYLEQTGRTDVWERTAKYNHALGQSATLNDQGEVVDGRMGRGRIAFVNSFRWEQFNKWVDVNLEGKHDPALLTADERDRLECVTHSINLMLVSMTRADCIAVKVIASTLVDSLGCRGLQHEAIFMLAATVYGLYQGASGMVKMANANNS